jgi:hypothetical protein
MGMYTGLRFKGIVKKEFRDEFGDIALNGNWNNSTDRVFREFSNVSRAAFIPCGSLTIKKCGVLLKRFQQLTYQKLITMQTMGLTKEDFLIV